MLTTVSAHVDLQRAGTGAAFVALGEGADALVGVGVLGLVLGRGGGRRLLLSAGAVVHEVGVQVALAPVPDPTVLTGEDVLCCKMKMQTIRGENQGQECVVAIIQYSSSIGTKQLTYGYTDKDVIKYSECKWCNVIYNYRQHTGGGNWTHHVKDN